MLIEFLFTMFALAYSICPNIKGNSGLLKLLNKSISKPAEE